MVQAGPLAGLIAQLLLLVRARGDGRSGACRLDCRNRVGSILDVALGRGASRVPEARLGPADWVTLTRATLAVGVAALVADSFGRPRPSRCSCRSRSLRSSWTVDGGSRDAPDGARWAGTSTPRSTRS